MVKCLEPIVDSNSKILILGSLASVKSIKKQEYYGNSQNHFWKIMSYVFNDKIDYDNYESKLSFLKRNHIALWDVISNAERKGSLDISIKKEKYNDLYNFINDNGIKLVYVNGNKAEESLKKYMKLNGVEIIYKKLPSSSSANTMYSLEDKKIEWKKLIKDIL